MEMTGYRIHISIYFHSRSGYLYFQEMRVMPIISCLKESCYLLELIFIPLVSTNMLRWLPYSLVIRQRVSLPKSFQKSRSILQDGSRFLGLFCKGNI